MNTLAIKNFPVGGKVALTATSLFAILAAGNAQVNAEYFENPGFGTHRTTLSLTTFGQTVMSAPGVNTTNGFSVRYSSFFTPDSPGSYRFRLIASLNTEAKLYSYNGQLLTSSQNSTTVSDAITLAANQAFGLFIFVNSSGLNRSARIEVSKDGGAFAPIQPT